MPFAAVQGLAIHYETGPCWEPARGSAVVFVHGAGGTHENWRFQIRHLGVARNALAVDLPGHGDSQGEGHGTIAEYREIVRALLEILGIRRAALVGHSMGGGIALSFALAYPERLAALVLVGTGAKLRVHPEIFSMIRRDMTEAARLISGWAFSRSCLPATVTLGAEAMARNRPSVLEADFRACDAFDVRNDIAAITSPTLILCGQDDRLTPVKYAQFLHERIPGAVLALLPEAGHMAMLEQPAAFNQRLAAFLDTHLDDSPGQDGGEGAMADPVTFGAPEDLRQAIRQMCAETVEMLRAAREGFQRRDAAALVEAARRGKTVHRREKELTDYVVSHWHILPEDVRGILFVPTHLERIGDNVENLVRCIDMIQREEIAFPERAVSDISALFAKGIELLESIRELLATRSRILMRYVMKSGEELQALAGEHAQAHQDRLVQGLCLPGASSSFLAMLDYLKGIEWHTRQIVQKMTERG